MRSSLLATMVVASLWLAGAQGNGCAGPDDGPGGGTNGNAGGTDGGGICPALLCDVDCPSGKALDANGCETCACAQPKACSADSDCSTGQVCDRVDFCEQPNCPPGGACASVCLGRCVQAPAKPTACWTDSDCAQGFRCDTVNYCDQPPGCGAGMGCPAVCYGRCVQEPPPSQCGDGTALTCGATPPDCAAPLVPAVYGGCWKCVDPSTCEGGCASDADCGQGERCTQKSFDPCGDCDPSTGPCAECPARLYGVCEPAPECACTEEYAPVCGADGRTYGNACAAACAGVQIAHDGACEQPSCDIECLVADPVCGSDGHTYGCGAPEAACHGASVVHSGACGVACRQDSECRWGERCLLPPPNQQPSTTLERVGECAPLDFCNSTSDCSGLAAPQDCAGDWTCEQNRCTFACTR